MLLPIERPTCRSRNSPRRRADDGMVLVILMLMATLVLIALTAGLPSVYQEGQREKEEETVFRGYQYGRAVALFHRQFNRYPASVKELLETNKMRFLRKAYTDPMDPKGAWRFIHANAAGVLLDSKNQPQGFTGLGQPGSQSGGGDQSTQSAASSSGAGQGFGMSGGMGPRSSFLSGQGVQTSPFSLSSSSSSDSGNPIMGGFIVGVAPTSHRESIRVMFKKHHYDEWEFTGIDMGIFGIAVGMTGFGQPPQGPGQVTGGAPGTTNPPSPTPLSSQGNPTDSSQANPTN